MWSFSSCSQCCFPSFSQLFDRKSKQEMLGQWSQKNENIPIAKAFRMKTGLISFSGKYLAHQHGTFRFQSDETAFKIISENQDTLWFSDLETLETMKYGLSNLKNNLYFGFPFQYFEQAVHDPSKRLSLYQSLLDGSPDTDRMYLENDSIALQYPQAYTDILARMNVSARYSRSLTILEAQSLADAGFKYAYIKQPEWGKHIAAITEDSIPFVDWQWLQSINEKNNTNAEFTLYSDAKQFLANHNIDRLNQPCFIFVKHRKAKTNISESDTYLLQGLKTTFYGNLWIKRTCITLKELLLTLPYFDYTFGKVILFERKTNYEPPVITNSHPIIDAVKQEAFINGQISSNPIIAGLERANMLPFLFDLNANGIITEFYGRNIIKVWYAPKNEDLLEDLCVGKMLTKCDALSTSEQEVSV